MNYAKPLSWWFHIDQPQPRMTTPNTVEIRGWIFNPLAEVISIEAFIDGKRYGKLAPGEMRPDVYRRFRMPHSRTSGFSGRIRYETTINQNITLILRITDDVNETFELPVKVLVSAPVEEYAVPQSPVPLPEAHIVDELKKILDFYRLRFIDPPVIADWDTGLNLAAVFPDLRVIQPHDPKLPYINGGVDIVMVGPQHIRNMENVKYAAKNLIVGVLGGHSGGRVEFKAQWLNPPEYTESVSVIITAGEYVDLNMLRDLLVTMQNDLIVEIIILHDVKLVIESILRADPRVKEVFTSPESSLVVSRNRAALSALGDVVVFINATDIPQDNWLAPMMHILARRPECGAVFGKILATDRRLFDAGGIVFTNGVFYDYGYSDVDVNAARYNYIREIDAGYMGLFATRRNLFASFQGFRTDYSADGYEILDYCFRLKDEGRQIIYQPDSVVYQLFTPRPEPEEDRVLFVEHWKDRLSGQPRAPIKFDVFDLYKLTAQNILHREALICLTDIPSCTLSVEYRRLWQMIHVLRDQNYTVRLLLAHNVEFEHQRRAFTESGVPVYTIDGDQLPLNVQEFFDAHRFEVVVCFGWQTARHFMLQIREHLPKARLIIEAFEVEFIRSQQNQLTALSNDYGQSLVEEMNIYRQADRVVLATASDFELLSGLNPLQRNLLYIPFMDDLSVSKLAFGQRTGILLFGDFRQEADRNALKFFLDKVLPKIDSLTLTANPVSIIGCGLENLESLKPSQVQYVGWVPSILPYIERARVVVAPALLPHSMALSILQAMLVGTPVVTTSVGAAGFDLRHDENVLIGDDRDTLAEHIFNLLDNDELWIRIAAFGYEHMLNTRSVRVFSDLYAELLESLASMK